MVSRKHSRRTRRRHHRLRGGGVQTSQQFFDPAVYPPSAGLLPAPSTAPTASNIRPVLMSTFQAGGSRRRSSRRRGARGGGYQTSQQFFDPAVYPPSAGIFPAPSTAPTANAVRPVLLSTFSAGQTGGTRRRRGARMSGGFSPSVMGGFVANAQAVAVPLVLYLAYHTMVPKKGSKTRKSSRK
jgi:hypothetical protein